MEPKIREENYYIVHGWMIRELHLKGIDLSVYAIIYGFSQDGETVFSGSIQYLCDFCGGCSRPTVINALKRLTEAGLLNKETQTVNGVTFNRYSAVLPPVKKIDGVGKEILQHPVKNFDGGSKNFLPNKEVNKEEQDKEVYKEEYTGDKEIDAAIDEWLQYKKERREAYKPTGLKAFLTTIRKAIDQNGKQSVIEAIHTSMANGWKGLFFKPATGSPGTGARSATCTETDTDRVRRELNEWLEGMQNGTV